MTASPVICPATRMLCISAERCRDTTCARDRNCQPLRESALTQAEAYRLQIAIQRAEKEGSNP